MTEDFNETPIIGWEVAAVDARVGFAIPNLHKPKPHRERSASRELADARKHDLQAVGMVASVTPVFLGKAKQKAALQKRQVAPMGAFAPTGRWPDERRRT